MKKLFGVLFVVGTILTYLWLSRQHVSAVENIRVAEDHLLKGNYADAVRLFEALSEKEDSDRGVARAGLLQALFMTGQYDKVEQLAGRFLADQPKEFSNHLFLGKSWERRGKYAEALRAFEST